MRVKDIDWIYGPGAEGLLKGGDGYEALYGAQSSSLWRRTLTPVLGKT